MKRLFPAALLASLYAVMGLVAAGLRLACWRRALVRRHVARCLPSASAARRREVERAFYRYLGELAAEVAYEPFMDAQALAGHVRLENPEAIEDRLASRRKVLILSAHHANWEWLLMRCSTGFTAPLTAVHKRLRNDTLERCVRGLRERFGCTMVETKQLVPHLIERRGQIPLLAMLADQSPSVKNPQQVWIDFFGQSTAFYGGPGWIGAKFGYDAYFAAMHRERRGVYVVRLVELLPGEPRKEPEQILRAYVAALEDHVRASPEQYFWAYNRWKREKPLYD